MENKVREAFEVIKCAMIDDSPSEPGSYAHSWHCNIAMACFDAIKASDKNQIGNKTASEISNDAASRFMRLCFDVETTQ